MKKAAPVIIRTDEEIRKDLTALRTALFAARKRTGDDGLSYAVAKHGKFVLCKTDMSSQKWKTEHLSGPETAPVIVGMLNAL